jgi:hypothetical protein
MAASSTSRFFMSSRPERMARPRAILMLTSTSEVLTPAELSMASVLSGRRLQAIGDAAFWVMPRLAPSPTTLTRSSSPVMRMASLARSPIASSASLSARTIGADAAEEQQVGAGPQDGAIS